MPSIKYLISYLSFLLEKRILQGRKIEPIPHSLISAKIKNLKLADELEEACNNQQGVLSYAQFLHAIQFGTYGYHASHRFHGMTDVHLRWGKALLLLCQTYKLTNIIEFGFGDCALALELIANAEKLQIPLTWNGVEISEELLTITRKLFTQKKKLSYLGQLTTDITNISMQKPSLVLFSFSLDSIPPLVFTNTKSKPGVPNALVGVSVKNGVLEEKILDETWLKEITDATLHNGIYTHKGISFNLSSWILSPGQYAFIPIHSFIALKKTVDMLPKNSMIFIIDEFQYPPVSFETQHLCVPKDLEKFGPNRNYKNLINLYKQAGKDILYYCSYLTTYTSILTSLGFSDIQSNGEYEFAYNLLKKLPPKLINPACFAIQAKKTGKQKKILTVAFPLKKG